jgi:hypothetical protein
MLKLRKTLGLHLWASLGAALLLFVLWAPAALADGTETLGPPGIAIAAGSDVIAAGTGLNLAGQPQGEGTIVFDVPADATVNQVLLYWEGQAEDAGATPVSDTAVVDGVPVVGTLIGGPLFFASPADNALQDRFVFQHEWYDSAYRADITGLGLVGPGANSLFIDIELGPDTRVINGAGVLVVIETPGAASDIQLRDGIDMAFFDVGTGFAPPPRDTTVLQTFSFEPSSSDRTATLDLFFSSVAGQVSGQGADRPSSIEVTVGGTTQTFSDLLGSVDGEEWDTVVLPITIPAGADELSVQAFSRDDLGTGKLVASFLWVTAALSIEEEEGEGCISRTPGFWCTHDRVTELFLPVESCGLTVDNVDVATPTSSTEDLARGNDFNAAYTSPQQLQLIRQCTAAQLNIAATRAVGGNCEADFPGIDALLAECCDDLCTSGASGPTISQSTCIERLDDFNNSEDSLTCDSDPAAPFPFCPSLGANGFNATPEACEDSNGNGYVNPGRNLGPRS